MAQPTITDLLARLIDLAPVGTPPHRPGSCTALCVPACAGETATVRRHESVGARRGSGPTAAVGHLGAT